MRRREFITLLSGVAAVCALEARAQQTDRVRRIGVLMSTAVDDPQDQTRHTVFAQGLQELGWTIGRNVRIDYRWGASSPDNARKYAAELAAGARCDAGERLLSTGGCTTDKSHHPGRVRQCHRSGQRRFCRKLGAAGRQRHRLCLIRVHNHREIGGVTQTDRAECDAGGDPE